MTNGASVTMHMSSLRTDIVSMGGARVLDYLIQMLLPIFLARIFAPAEYGQYRLLWLVVTTSMIFSIMYMPQGLYYFLPHGRTRSEQSQHVSNCLGFLFLSGSVIALLALVATTWQGVVSPISDNAMLLPGMVLLTTMTSLLDFLPGADHRVREQAGLLIGLSLLRAGLLIGIALSTRDIDMVFASLILFATIKMAVLLVYINRRHSSIGLGLSAGKLLEQLRYSLPFGVAGGLHQLRLQLDQWMAALMFTPAEYAAFTCGIYVAPIMNVVRDSIATAALPRLMRLHADVDGGSTQVLELFRKINTATSLAIMPLLTWLFVYADVIVELIFTSSYSAGANVMRMYVLGFVVLTMETNSLLRVYCAGRITMSMDAMLLPVTVVSSYLGARLLGLEGAALGAVGCIWIGEITKFHFVSRLIRVPATALIDWRSCLVIIIGSVLGGALAYSFRENAVTTVIDLLTQVTAGGIVILVTAIAILCLTRPAVVKGCFGIPLVRTRHAE